VFVTLLFLALTLAAIPASAAPADPKLDAALDSALTYRAGLRRVNNFVESRPDLFPPQKVEPEKPRLLSRDAKQEVRNAWKSLLDYVLALDSLQLAHAKFWLAKRGQRDRALIASYAAFAAQHRSVLEFLAAAENDPALHPLLDEAAPDVGMPKGGFSALRARFSDPKRAREFAALSALYTDIDEKDKTADAAVREDAARLRELLKASAEELSEGAAERLLQKPGYPEAFAVPPGAVELVGDTKLLRKGGKIKPEQIAGLKSKLEPGDILLQRREWYVSNIGLPGYWTHVALYLGPGIAEGGDVIEAVSEGVIVTTLEQSADADALAVLRPRLEKSRKEAAIKHAASYLGRPYDYDFDFRTDTAVIDTELIHEAYEPELRLPLEELLGRPSIPPHLIARKFDFEYGTSEQQLELVSFIEGDAEASTSDFRKTWLRPKWKLPAAKPQ
jgi:hypothetical protein